MNYQYPLITVVLMSYNQEGIIKDSIESVLNQDYENLEIVLSDDCSTDNTFEIIKSICKNYKGSHKLILNQNKINLGIGNHYNFAARLANGEYIITAAGDDISLPGRVTQSVEIIRRDGVLGGVIGRFHSFRDRPVDQGDWQPSHAIAGKKIRAGSEDWFELFNKGKFLGTPGAVAMWNRQLFTQFDPPPPGVLAEDILMNTRCLIAGLGISFTDEKFVYYRQHPGNSYAGLSKAEFERKLFYTRAIGLVELRNFRAKYPECHDNEYWEKINRMLESTVFRSLTHMRQPYIGRFKSYILRLIGLNGARLEN